MNKPLSGCVLLLLLAATGCGPKGAASDAGNPTSAGQGEHQEQTTAPFSAKLLIGENANQYTVQLSWGGAADFHGTNRITRSGPDGEVQFTEGSDEHSHTDSSVRPGTTYSYRLDTLDSSGTQEVGSQSILVPIDLVISGAVQAASLANPGRTDAYLIDQYDRVYLEENSHLFGGFKPLILRTTHLTVIGKGATLENIPPNLVAGALTNGRQGGDIFVDAKYAAGPLTLIVRGERGGVGPKGAKGARGRPATPDGMISPGKGLPGGQGLVGQTGGDSGSIAVKVSNPDPTFQVFSHLDPGAGGEGGPGGDGGAWGNYPSRPDLDTPAYLSSISNVSGAQGPQGIAGRQGAACFAVGPFRTGC